MQITDQIPAKMFHDLYGTDCGIEEKRSRFAQLIHRHRELFAPPERTEVMLFSTPGRTELGGNHTDHNHGRVLAASVHLDTIAAVSRRQDSTVLLLSQGYPEVSLDISSTRKKAEETGTTEALVRGIADYFKKRGISIGGFQANTTSNVLKGSGLSSSAAVEITIASIFNSLFNGSLYDIDLAQAGQYAENTYFGKPSGLMDQIACASGGIVGIDFKNPEYPEISLLSTDFRELGYVLCVVDTGGNHADLTDEYAAIPDEMRAVAACFKKSCLRGITVEALIAKAGEIRAAAGDRGWLRALHFVLDDERVEEMIFALKHQDIEAYLQQVNDSGRSSQDWLQNIYPCSNPREQGITLALALTKLFLESESLPGAYRVHGGGFGGTIQAYIPEKEFPAYRREMEGFFGKGSVTPLTVRFRPAGKIASGLIS